MPYCHMLQYFHVSLIHEQKTYRVTYHNTQTIDLTFRLTGDFFQSFGIYFHQIKQPLAITNFFWPLDIQGSGTKGFQWSAQVSYLLKQTFCKL